MDYARAAIFDERGYPATQVEMIESFPFDFSDRPFDKNFIAGGFNFDDMGDQAELGSGLLRRLYSIEWFIFGQTATYARNLANVLKFALQRDQMIPLRDYALPDAPVIDMLEVIGVSAEHQVVNNPEPWQEFIWTTTLRLEDVYFANLV